MLTDKQKLAIELVRKNEESKSPSCSQNSTAVATSAEVDSHLNNASTYEVIVHEGKPLSTYMNWSDMKKNHNKFYVCQAL